MSEGKYTKRMGCLDQIATSWEQLGRSSEQQPVGGGFVDFCNLLTRSRGEKMPEAWSLGLSSSPLGSVLQELMQRDVAISACDMDLAPEYERTVIMSRNPTLESQG